MSLHHFTAGIPHCSRVRTPTADHQIKVRGRGMIRRAEKQIFALHTLPFYFTIFSPMFFLCDWVDIFYLFRTAKLQNKEKSFNNSLTLCNQCGPQAKKVWTHWHVPWSFRFLNEFFSTFLITIDLKSFCRICTLPLWVDVCISIITGCTSSCLHLPTMWILKLSRQTSTWQEVRRRLLSPLSLFTSLRVQSSSRYSAKVTGSITAGKRRLRNTPHLSAFGCFLWQAIGFECSAEHQWRQMER